MSGLKISSPDLEATARNIDGAISRRDEFVIRNLRSLGRRVEWVMKQVIEPNRYTGALADSIQSEADGSKVTIGTTAKSGQWDRGMILERGTRPIPNLPFEPIRMWAEFRGLPAGPVWAKIRREGVSAHPFLDETLSRGETQVAIQHTAMRIGMDLVGYSFQALGGHSVAGAQFLSGGEG